MATRIVLFKLKAKGPQCDYRDCGKPSTFFAQSHIPGGTGWNLCNKHAQACRDKGIVHEEVDLNEE